MPDGVLGLIKKTWQAAKQIKSAAIIRLDWKFAYLPSDPNRDLDWILTSMIRTLWKEDPGKIKKHKAFV